MNRNLKYYLENKLDDGAEVLSSIQAVASNKSDEGVLVVLTGKIIFFKKGLLGEVYEEYLMHSISGLRLQTSLFGRVISFESGGDVVSHATRRETNETCMDFLKAIQKQCSDESKPSIKFNDNSLKQKIFCGLVVLFVGYLLVKEPNNRSQTVIGASSSVNSSNDANFSAWSGAHIGLQKYIKNKMHDPSSYSHIDTRYIDHGATLFVVMEFRGNNQFGALVKRTVRANVDAVTGDVIEIVSSD